MINDKDKNRPMSLAEFRKMRHTLLPENRKIKKCPQGGTRRYPIRQPIGTVYV